MNLGESTKVSILQGCVYLPAFAEVLLHHYNRIIRSSLEKMLTMIAGISCTLLKTFCKKFHFCRRETKSTARIFEILGLSLDH